MKACSKIGIYFIFSIWMGQLSRNQLLKSLLPTPVTFQAPAPTWVGSRPLFHADGLSVPAGFFREPLQKRWRTNAKSHAQTKPAARNLLGFSRSLWFAPCPPSSRPRLSFPSPHSTQATRPSSSQQPPGGLAASSFQGGSGCSL